MAYRGKGDNKDNCDKVIKEILENWDERVCVNIQKEKCNLKEYDKISR